MNCISCAPSEQEERKATEQLDNPLKGRRFVLHLTSNQIKPFDVNGIVGTHDTVPKIEIQTKIGPVFFVVQRMMSDRVQQYVDTAFHKPTWKNLVTAMTENIERDLPAHKNPKCNWMSR